MAGLASGIMIVGTMNVYAQNNINTLPIIPADIMKDSVNDVSDIIYKVTDDIEIQPVETESSYVYVQEEPAYTQVYYYEEPVYEQTDLTLTYDEFMSMYEDLDQEDTTEAVVDTSIEQAAYDQALANYNAALAEYEAASQMIETTKEVEVEIVE